MEREEAEQAASKKEQERKVIKQVKVDRHQIDDHLNKAQNFIKDYHSNGYVRKQQNASPASGERGPPTVNPFTR